MEIFDAVGRFRANQGGKAIDARGERPDGVSFDGPVELKQYLVSERKAEFVRNLTQRLLSFALGRELHYFHEPAIEKITPAVEAAGYSSRALIEQIVLSYPFQFLTGQLPTEERNTVMFSAAVEAIGNQTHWDPESAISTSVRDRLIVSSLFAHCVPLCAQFTILLNVKI